MKRTELAHILRAAAEIIGDGSILVVGSQAVLATMSEDEPPARATLSMEADITFLDGDVEKPDRVEGTIGEGSLFHSSFGYYAQGVGLETAVLPKGRRERVVRVEWDDCGEARAICPEVHDLVVSKPVAGREKDIEFAQALLDAGHVDTELLVDRAERLPLLPAQVRRVCATLTRLAAPG